METVEELRYLVLAAQREGSRRLAEALRPLAVSPAQAEVVTVLRTAGRPLSVRELGELLVCETGSPSRLTRSVVDAGWARTVTDEADARVRRLELTEAGAGLAVAIRQIESAFHHALAATISGSTADELVVTLRLLVEGSPAGRALARRRGLGGPAATTSHERPRARPRPTSTLGARRPGHLGPG